MAGLVLDSNNPQQLARFYVEVLGYVVVEDEPGWVELTDPTGRRPHFSLQGINRHVQHAAETPQGNKFHLDLGIDDETDGEALAAHAEQLQSLGARRIERIGPEGEGGTRSGPILKGMCFAPLLRRGAVCSGAVSRL